MQADSAFQSEVKTARQEKAPAQFPPLETVTSPTVPTDAAAYYINRKPQTLLVWSSRECGPIRPLRILGRLAWPVAEIRKLTGVA